MRLKQNVLPRGIVERILSAHAGDKYVCQIKKIQLFIKYNGDDLKTFEVKESTFNGVEMTIMGSNTIDT